MINVKITFLFVLVFRSFSFAQPTTDEQLAVHYYQTGECDKAIMYYEKLYAQNPSDIYYGNYFKCLLKLEKYKETEKLVKRQIKKFPEMVNYPVDLGYVLAKSGNETEAKKQYHKIMKELLPVPSHIISVANAFLGIGEKNYAVETYQRGKVLLKNGYPFNFELADIYASIGDYEMMLNQLFHLLDQNETYLQEVQNVLNKYMVFEPGSQQNQLLKTQLLKRIQQNGASDVFAEMLIWLYIQQRDFENTFIQIKAIDKKNKEEGGRLISLAQLCVSNQQYDVAVKSYQYVIDKGEHGRFYTAAKMELLNTLHQKITTSGNYKNEDLTELENLYKNTINELGKSAATLPLIKDLAELESAYLYKTSEAIQLLEEAIVMPRSHPQLQAECKIALADVQVMTGEIWDASLLYSQVEKEYKYDPLGETAKFKNAKIAYYAGDFKWAKAQLDVLKGSTSKLIANDAMQLSLLITDNTGIDTTTEPLTMFARAALFSLQNQDSLALLILDSINKFFPAHALADDILFQKYKMAMKKQNFAAAENCLAQIVELHAYDILADDALFLLAQLEQFNLKNTEKAKELYEKLLTDFPSSIYTVEARKRFRYLRGDNIPKEEMFFNN